MFHQEVVMVVSMPLQFAHMNPVLAAQESLVLTGREGQPTMLVAGVQQ